MKVLFTSIAALYLVFMSFYFFGDDIKDFFVDKAALMQAETENKRAENEKLMIENNHEKDIIILTQQYKREMSEIFNSRFLSWGVISFLGVLVVVLVFHVCKQNAKIINAIAKNNENLQKTAIDYEKVDKLAIKHDMKRIS